MDEIVFDGVKGDRIIQPVDYLYGYQGQSLTLPEWAEFLEVSTPTFRYRFKQCGFAEAVTMPSPSWKVPRLMRIDPGDRHRFKRHTWSFKDGGIYRRQPIDQGTTIVYLHREILDVTGKRGIIVKFKNGNKYDCRRANLEALPMHRHVRQTVAHPTGCSFRPSRGLWEAYIAHKGRRYFLGSFREKQNAIAAYQEAVDRIAQGHPPLID